jgi:hypothetical protein
MSRAAQRDYLNSLSGTFRYGAASGGESRPILSIAPGAYDSGKDSSVDDEPLVEAAPRQDQDVQDEFDLIGMEDPKPDEVEDAENTASAAKLILSETLYDETRNRYMDAIRIVSEAFRSAAKTLSECDADAIVAEAEDNVQKLLVYIRDNELSGDDAVHVCDMLHKALNRRKELEAASSAMHMLNHMLDEMTGASATIVETCLDPAFD